MQAKIIDVEIKAKASALKKLGVSHAEFHTALEGALESLADRPAHRLPRAVDIPLSVLGTAQRLGDLANIVVRLDDASSKQSKLDRKYRQQSEEAEDLRAKIDQRARLPMTLLSPRAFANNITPVRQEIGAG